MRNEILGNYIQNREIRGWKELIQKSCIPVFASKKWGEEGGKEIEIIKKWMNYPSMNYSSEHDLIADCVADYILKEHPEEKINVEEWRKLIF